MNHLTNDYGQQVISVGAPGSIERVRIEYPKLIDRLNGLYNSAYDCYGRGADSAIAMIRRAGIQSTLETQSLMMASSYGLEPPGSVTGFVMQIKDAE